MWGNCSTMNSLPRVHEYSHALRLLNTIKPIKGNGVNSGIIPLGARGNVGAYSVRAGKTDATDVEFVLYKTPVITYKADGRIIVKLEKWDTNTTREFISSILNLSCSAKSGKSLIELSGGALSIIPTIGLVLRYDVEASPPRLVFDAKPKFTGYVINRAKANKVRAQFSQFAKYFKGCVNLRSVEIIKKTYYDTQYNAIEYTGAEVIDALCDESTAVAAKPWTEWELLKHRPFLQFRPIMYNTYANWIAEYEVKCAEFFDLIKDDQPNDTKTQNFYKAMVICMILNGEEPNKETPHVVVRTLTTTVVKNLETIWKMYFARNILEAVVLKDGTPPNKTYADWMWMYDNAEIARADVLEAERKKISTRA